MSVFGYVITDKEYPLGLCVLYESQTKNGKYVYSGILPNVTKFVKNNNIPNEVKTFVMEFKKGYCKCNGIACDKGAWIKTKDGYEFHGYVFNMVRDDETIIFPGVKRKLIACEDHVTEIKYTIVNTIVCSCINLLHI